MWKTKMNDFEAERFAQNADKFFSGTEHDYQVAIQTEKYMNERELTLVAIIIHEKNIFKQKEMVINDYRKWRKLK
jgi:hypothetical protein